MIIQLAFKVLRFVALTETHLSRLFDNKLQILNLKMKKKEYEIHKIKVNKKQVAFKIQTRVFMIFDYL